VSILFVGGGRRTSLAKLFKQENIHIHGYETEANTPLSYECSVHKGLGWEHPSLASDILYNLNTYHLRYLLPLQDAAAIKLHEIGLGDRVIGAGLEAARICGDKHEFELFMEHHFYDIYPSRKRQKYPRIIKPRFGFGSRNIRVVKSYDEECDVRDNWEGGSNFWIVQDFINGIEFTVDAYFDKSGGFVGAVPRIRLRVAAGEVVDSVTLDKPDLVKYTKEVGQKIGLRGPTCFQYVVNDEGQAYLIEINARFGGGSILSCQAGFNMVQMIKQEYINDTPISPADFQPIFGLLMRRTFTEYYFDVQKKTGD